MASPTIPDQFKTLPDLKSPGSAPPGSPQPAPPDPGGLGRRIAKRGRWIWAIRFARCVVLLYLAYLLIAGIAQERFYFPSYMAAMAPNLTAIPERFEVLAIEPEPGVRVEALLTLPEDASADRPAPLVVFLHGNAEIIDEHHPLAEMYRSFGCAVLLPEYRGYGRSTGAPSQTAITADVIALLDMTLERAEIDDQLVIYHGRSMGGGIAGSVAAQRPPAALVLECTFTSLRAMLNRFLVPTFLVRNPMDTSAVLAELDIPVLIMHGDRDTLIPPSHARRNAQTAKQATLVMLPGCDHNDPSPNSALYRSSCRALIERLRAGRPAAGALQAEPGNVPADEPAPGSDGA
jgi:fermentation-respiration switch protein FrsA (DUF1100 family)